MESADGLPPLPGEVGTEPSRAKQKPATLHEAIERANNKLDAYEASLQETGLHEPHTTGTEHALHLVQKLRESFQTLLRTLDEKELPKKIDVGMFVAKGDENVDGEKHQERTKRMAGIERDADDLCDVIHMDMHQRIDKSRRNYQVTLWIAIPASIVGLLLVCGVLGSFYAWVFYPIRDLEAGVDRVAKGDFEHRIEVHSAATRWKTWPPPSTT